MTISVKEGLSAPAFWALIVRNFNLSLVKGEAGVLLAGMSCTDQGEVGKSATSAGSGVPSEPEVGGADRQLSCPNE